MRQTAYIWGDDGAVDMGVSDRAIPTPSLEFLRLASAGMTLAGWVLRPGLFSGVAALDMMAERAISECCAMPGQMGMVRMKTWKTRQDKTRMRNGGGASNVNVGREWVHQKN